MGSAHAFNLGSQLFACRMGLCVIISMSLSALGAMERWSAASRALVILRSVASSHSFGSAKLSTVCFFMIAEDEFTNALFGCNSPVLAVHTEYVLIAGYPALSWALWIHVKHLH